MKESAILTSNTAAISAMLPLLRSPLPMMTPPVESSLSLTITKEDVQLNASISLWPRF